MELSIDSRTSTEGAQRVQYRNRAPWLNTAITAKTRCGTFSANSSARIVIPIGRALMGIGTPLCNNVNCHSHFVVIMFIYIHILSSE